jgi:uncharacterized membrane protein YkvA (DUF1232 family)
MTGGRWLARLRTWARGLKNEIHVLHLAYRHPNTPVYAKIWLACVVGYAISPIDLIPDFIPVLGYLDDLVLLPLGIWLAARMIPPDIVAECRAKAKEPTQLQSPVRWLAATIIIILWVGFVLTLWRLARPLWASI